MDETQLRCRNRYRHADRCKPTIREAEWFLRREPKTRKTATNLCPLLEPKSSAKGEASIHGHGVVGSFVPAPFLVGGGGFGDLMQAWCDKAPPLLSAPLVRWPLSHSLPTSAWHSQPSSDAFATFLPPLFHCCCALHAPSFHSLADLVAGRSLLMSVSL
jgi:hypothetical protein